MGDLHVDTDALRAAASGLSRAAGVAGDVHERGGKLRELAAATGDQGAADATAGFLKTWSYGMGLLAEDAAALASVLTTSAAAFESVEAALTLAAGGVPRPVGPAAEIPVPALPASAPSAHAGTVRTGVPLASALSAADLVPGAPAEVEALAARLAGFAGDAAYGAAALRKLSLGGWVGKAAEVFAGELDDLPRRLDTAAAAFDDAARALRRHGGVLTEAQRVAAAAWALWQDAARQTQAWTASGAAAATAGAAPGGTDPGAAGAARAEVMLAHARDEVASSARALATALEAAEEGAPRKPGWLSRLAGGLASFGKGFAEGAVGMGEGALALAKLGVKLSPAGMALDPQGYLRTVEGLAEGVKAAATHPGATLAAIADLETWKSDPARALGRLAPDLLLTLATAGAGGVAARGAKAADVLEDAADLGAEARALRAAEDVRLPHEAAKPLDVRCLNGDPVDVASGEVVMAQSDVTLDGLLPLVLTRTHLSTYRLGRWFGPSWASTLDQRVEVEEGAVHVLGEDGTRLVYPVPDGGEAVLPRHGPARALARVGGGWVVSERGMRWVFAPGPDASVAWLVAVVDRQGHRIDVDRAAHGAPLTVRHSGGYEIAVDTADGRVTGYRLATPDGDVTLVRFGYDGRGRLAETVNSSGLPLRYSYDDAGRLTGWEDRNGITYAYGYDDTGRCVRGTGTGGFLDAEFAYRDRLTVVTNSLGQDSEFHLDGLGRVVRQVDPLGAVTEFGYDDRDRLLVRIDPLGRSTWQDWDADGNLTALTRPDGRQTRIAYDQAGLPTSVTQPDGAAWAYARDEAGNLISVTDPLGAVTSYAYDERGHVASVTDALGQVTRVETDAAGLPLEVSGPAGAVTRYVRDAFGRVVAVTDPVGGVTRLSWTVEGSLASRTLPDGTSDSWAYDGEGNLVAHTDPLGHVTRHTYTAFDLRASSTDPAGATTRYAYDGELRLRSVTDPDGLVWRYERDAAGRVVAETDVNGRRLTYAYDSAGQLISATNGAGQRTRYDRDDLGRVTARHTDDGAATFAYDPAGRLVRAISPDADLSITYDVLGRVLAETVEGRTVASTYDPLGRRVSRRTPAGVESVWDHGPLGPAGAVVAGHAIAFAYDPAGREIERALGGAVLSQAWDPAHRLTTQTITGPGADLPVVAQRGYRYRADGGLTDVLDSLAGTRSFTLDPVGRVTEAHTVAGPERYGYSPNGVITDASWPDAAPSADARGAREHAGALMRRAGSVTYDHDAAGRITARRHKTLSGRSTVWSYAWTADDRLASVTTPDGTTWRYAYDALGRRVGKHRLGPDGEVVETITFTWDGSRLIEQSGGGSTITWEYEPGTFRPLAQQVDAEFFAIVTDLIGAPSELVAADGAVTPVNRTSLWGAALGPDGPCPLRFPGQYADPETGLHYNNHRYYDPTTATYLSPDPLGLAAGVNPHAYVPNPTTWIDPLGLMSCGPDGTTPATAPRPAIVDPGKFDYLFGHVDSNAHNAARSLQNAQQFARIGVHDNPEGRSLLNNHFNDVIASDDNLLRSYIDAHGTFQIRDSLFAGPGGFLHFESTWHVTDGGLRLTTVIPRGGP